MKVDYTTVETLNLKALYTSGRCVVERKQWTAKFSGSLHEAWFRRGKMVSVDFHRDSSVTVTSGIGTGLRVNSKRYVEA